MKITRTEQNVLQDMGVIIDAKQMVFEMLLQGIKRINRDIKGIKPMSVDFTPVFKAGVSNGHQDFFSGIGFINEGYLLLHKRDNATCKKIEKRLIEDDTE